MRAMRWMAKWQEQEDGSEKNFSIIVLAQRLVSERVRKGSLYTLEAKRRHLDEVQVSNQELETNL
jgi:hypothetical protein